MHWCCKDACCLGDHLRNAGKCEEVGSASAYIRPKAHGMVTNNLRGETVDSNDVKPGKGEGGRRQTLVVRGCELVKIQSP